jgi:hypothetical protein
MWVPCLSTVLYFNILVTNKAIFICPLNALCKLPPDPPKGGLIIIYMIDYI